jgi:hypothetical protein
MLIHTTRLKMLNRELQKAMKLLTSTRTIETGKLEFIKTGDWDIQGVSKYANSEFRTW